MTKLVTKLKPIHILRGDSMPQEGDEYFLVVSGVVSYSDKQGSPMKFNQVPFGLGHLQFANKTIRSFCDFRALSNSLVMKLEQGPEDIEVDIKKYLPSPVLAIDAKQIH